jgi:methylmalonyl-CoA mutase N-terminal domain/subunit
LALRTQQVLAYESGVTIAPDPLGGSFFVESLTDAMEGLAARHLRRIDELGGAVAAIEAGYPQGEIERAAYEQARSVDRGDQVVVGVNRFVEEDGTGGAPETAVLPVDPELQQRQVERVRHLRSGRDQAAVTAALAAVEDTAHGPSNLLPPMKDALRLGATLGEASDALRRVFGEHEGGSPPLAAVQTPS